MLNIFLFLLWALWDWSFGCPILQRYDQANIAVGLIRPWFYIYTNRKLVKTILTNSQWQLTVPNASLNHYLQFQQNITHQNHHADMHQILSTTLATTLQTTPIYLDRAWGVFERSYLQGYGAFECTRAFLVEFWLLFFFGPQTIHQFEQIYAQIDQIMKPFHQNGSWQLFPFWAAWHTPHVALKQIGQQIKFLLQTVDKSSFFGRLSENSHFGENFLVETCFQSFLAFDFVLHSCVSIIMRVKDPIQTTFFYPWRMRRHNNGTWALINLKTANYLFSTGYRSCIGQVLAKKIHTFLQGQPAYAFEVLSLPQALDYHLPLWQPCATRAMPCDLPLTRLENELIGFEKGKLGQERFYHIHRFYEHPHLINLLIIALTKVVTSIKFIMAPTIVVAPEARGWPLAGIVAYHFHWPLYLVRKPGKLQGAVFSAKYQTAYSETEIQISQPVVDEPVNVILLDDGKNSGGTFQALRDLVQQKWPRAHIALKYVIFQHSKDQTSMFESNHFSSLRQHV